MKNVLNQTEYLIDVFELPDTTIAYFAGLFDGDGCIGLNQNGKFTRFSIQIDNSDPRVIEDLHLAFGGGKTRFKYMKWDRFMYRWVAYGKRGELILKTLYPYLRIKKEQAALTFLYRQYTGRRNCTKQRKEIVDKARALKDRGKLNA